MLLDSLAIRALTLELDRTVSGLRIEKIHQPAADTVVLRLDPAPAGRHLTICLDRTFGHLGLSARPFVNPATPPAFCGLLRKYLGNARLRGVRQVGLERVVELAFTASHEGQPAAYLLTVELFGNIPNAYLTDVEGRLLGACRHWQGIERLSGGSYVPPAPTGRPGILEVSREPFAAALEKASERGSAKALMAAFDGLGRGAAELLLERARDEGADAAWTALAIVRASIELGVPALCLVPGQGKREPVLLPWMPAAPLPPGAGLVESACEVLETSLGRGLGEARTARIRGEVEGLLGRQRERARERLQRALEDTERANEAERYERWGHLLQAHPGAAGPYATQVTLRDLFEPDAPELEIPLKPGMTLAANARACFNRARRLRRLLPMARQARSECEELVERLEQMQQEVLRVSALAPEEACRVLAAIRQALVAGGAEGTGRRPGRGKSGGLGGPREFRSSDGYRILVGRSGRDNDLLVTRTARKGDLWLHAHESPGAHVLVKLSGADCPGETLREAAGLAAHFSPHRYSSKALVAFTRAENVKKPAGAPAGLVTLRSYQTLVVACDPTLPVRLVQGRVTGSSSPTRASTGSGRSR